MNIVNFEAADIDTERIVAVVNQPAANNNPDITIVILDNNFRINLVGASRDKFLHWWKTNMTIEQVELSPAQETIVVQPSPPTAPVVGKVIEAK